MQRSTLLGFFGVLGGIVAFSAATGVASLIWRPPKRDAASLSGDARTNVRQEVFQERQVETAYLGVTSEMRGAELAITQVTQNTAASRVGLQPGDVIVSIDDEPVSDPDSLGELIRSHQPGDRVRVRVKRNAETLDLETQLGQQTRTEIVQGGPSSGGTIRGVVTETQSGAPIANADVMIQTVTRNRRRTVVQSRESTKTDSAGQYALQVARSSEPLELLVMRDGYDQRRDAVVVNGDMNMDVEMAFDPRPVLRGEVRVKSTGELVTGGVFVRASKRGFLGLPGGGPRMNVEKGGRFEFRVEPGHYTVTAHANGLEAKVEDVLVTSDGAGVRLELASDTGPDEEDVPRAVASKPARR